MKDTIYYDENLFYINDIVNTISRGLRLDLDPDLFVDKFVEDILFVENALSVLHSSLINEDRLVSRADYLRRLIRAKKRFAEVLESIARSTRGFSTRIAPFHDKFLDIARGEREHVQSIRDVLKAMPAPEENLKETTHVHYGHFKWEYGWNNTNKPGRIRFTGN